MLNCADCGKELDDTAVGDPCPACGNLRRDGVVQVGALLVSTSVLKATASVGYNPHRPWQQKWHDVEHGLDQIENAYAQEAMNNEDVRRIVEGFVKSCRELADWLWEDTQNSNVSKKTVMDFVTNDSAMNVCDGMANTIKQGLRI